MASSCSSYDLLLPRQSITSFEKKHSKGNSSSSSSSLGENTSTCASVYVIVKETRQIVAPSSASGIRIQKKSVHIPDFHTRDTDNINLLISDQVLLLNNLDREIKDSLIHGISEYTNQCLSDIKTSNIKVMSIFVEVKVLTRNHRESSPYGFSPASKRSIEKLKLTKYEDHLQKDACCSICKDEIACESKVREMPCSHVFHDPCIVQWLLIQNSCPLCRLKLPTD